MGVVVLAAALVVVVALSPLIFPFFAVMTFGEFL